MTRRLPPFAAIRAFEAAARHLSFKDAAAELALTPAAVSHQVKQLETLVGRTLFVRRARRVELTADGEELAGSLSPALDAIAVSFARFAPQVRRTVTLASGPIFAARWLVPRLGEFWAAHPQIDLRVHHSPLPVWKQLAQFDLAIAWGHGEWAAVSATPLLRIDVTPVLAPSLQEHGTLQPGDILDMPILHHRDDTGWRQWLRAAGIDRDAPLPGTVFEDANVVLQATLAGKGISLGVTDFVRDDLASGRLVQPFTLTIDPGDAYHLVRRQPAPDDPTVAAVWAWLAGQASADMPVVAESP